MNRYGYKKKLKEIRIEIKDFEKEFEEKKHKLFWLKSQTKRKELKEEIDNLEKQLKYKAKNFMKYKRKLDNLPKKIKSKIRRKK